MARSALGLHVEFTELEAAARSALQARLDAIRAQLLGFIQDYDVIVCPVMAMPAVPHGGSNQPGYGDTYNEPHNITGWPAAVVRGGTSPQP